MIKIIAAIDGLKPSLSTIQYSVELVKQTGAHLVGVFLEDFTYQSYRIRDLITPEGISEERRKALEEKDRNTRHEAVVAFENTCRQAGLTYSIHHDKGLALQELLHESVYADLL